MKLGCEGGSLLKDSQNSKKTIFHGARVLELSMLSRVPRISGEVVENYQKLCNLEQGRVLEQAKEVWAGQQGS